MRSNTVLPRPTPLYEQHLACAGHMTDFGGWSLPIHYGSQIQEHHHVRQHAGMFDVSHMTVSDITGEDTLSFLSNVLANDIAKASSVSGKAIYSCMLNEDGGVIDDLIAYYLSDEHCRLITNAATNEKDMAWLQAQAKGYSVTITEKPELALIAVQGPAALAKLQQVLPEHLASLTSSLKRFQGGFAGDVFIGRTGYTGEDGVEIVLPGVQAPSLWEALNAAGIPPCGLGARDTLRLEAGMALYGHDLDEAHTPLDCGLAWTVSLTDERDFVGKTALLEPQKYQMMGLLLEGKGVLRAHQEVIVNEQVVGMTTSGMFSPTLGHSIALARVTVDQGDALNVGKTVYVQVRKKQLAVQVVKYPFVVKC
ncbi:glycine cleavage system protein T [Candidatus Endobugula sertula]|uniref:Aminomethyltransferase n=1 Tax=Candidatus Endobugula sertula TaxID=62101 RepID=A0A1D2QPX7_9GAMM|nr:glycine cleavage system protein T [Candidatus Endobugula sertula]